jgi:hypothetical protein
VERFVNSGSVLTDVSFKLKHMRAKGIHIRYSGTNQSSQTVSLTNLGTLLCQYAQRPRISVTATALSLFNDYDFGENIRTSTSGGAVDMNLYIPFRNPINPLDTNIVDITDDDYITFPAVSGTYVSALTVSVYIDEDDSGDNLYRPSIYSRSQVLTSECPIFLPDRNIYRLLGIQPTTTDPTKIILAKGSANSGSADKVIKLDVPYTVAQTLTHREGNLEPTATFNAFMLNLGSVRSCIGQDYELQLIGGAGTFAYTVFALDMINRQGSTVIDRNGNVTVITADVTQRMPTVGGGSVAVADKGPIREPRHFLSRRPLTGLNG